MKEFEVSKTSDDAAKLYQQTFDEIRAELSKKNEENTALKASNSDLTNELMRAKPSSNSEQEDVKSLKGVS